MDITDYIYPFDINGTKASNYIKSEPHVTTAINGEDYNVIVPKIGPFHVNNLKLVHVESKRELVPFVDFSLLAPFKKLNDEFDRACFGIIAIHDKRLVGNWEVSYYTLGGEYSLDHDEVLQDLVDYAYNPRLISYEDIAPETIPETFPPRPHTLDVDNDVYYTADVIFALNNIALGITGDLKPFHKHELVDTNGLVEELSHRVDTYGNYKIGLCAPYFLENHFGTVALELPLDMVGMRVDIEVVFGSGQGKGIVSIGGVVTADGDWTDTYAVSEGTCPAQTAACGLNSNGHPYIWIGDDSTNWVDTNALLSSVLINANDPKRYTNGWKFGTVELPEERVTSFPIEAGGLAGLGLVPTSRRINGYPLTSDVNLRAIDVHAVPANAQGEVEEVVTFANGSKAVIKAKRTTPEGEDILLVMLLDDIIEYGSPEKQTILNGQSEELPCVRTKDGLKRILVEGDDIGGGGPGSATYVPESRKINGKPLDKDITLTATDVNALFFNEDGALNADMLLTQGHKYMLMVAGAPKPVTQITTIDSASTTLLGAEGTRTVLQGSDSSIPAVLIGSTLYPIKLENYGASEGIKLVLEEFVKANTTKTGGAVPILGVTESPVYGSLITVLGNNSVQTVVETKNELIFDNGTVKARPVLRNSDGVLIDKNGLGTDLTLAEEKRVVVKRAGKVVPLVTATKTGVQLGDSSEEVHLASASRPTMMVEGTVVEIASITDITTAPDGDGVDATSINAVVPTTPLTPEGIQTRPTIMVSVGDGLTPIWFLPTKATLSGGVYTLQQLDDVGNVIPPLSENGIGLTNAPITLHGTNGLFTAVVDVTSFPEGVSFTKLVFEIEDSTGTAPTKFLQGTLGTVVGGSVTVTGNLSSVLPLFDFTDLSNVLGPTIGLRVGEAATGPQFLPLVGGEVTATDTAKEVRWTIGINGQNGELMLMSTVDDETTVTSVSLDGIIKGKDVSFGESTIINKTILAMEKRIASLEENK